MLCLNMTIILIIRLFGSRRGMAKWMMENDKVLHFDVRPYCCCCHCLPGMLPNETKIRRLTYFVRQSPLVRVILQIVIVILSVEGVSDGSAVLQTLNGLGVASTLIAVFVCHVIVTATKDVLTPYNMYVIFRCVDTTQMLYTFQKFILDLIAKNGGMGGLPIASPTMVSRYCHSFAMLAYVAVILPGLKCENDNLKINFLLLRIITGNNQKIWHNVAMTIEVGLVCVVMFRNIRSGKSAFFASSEETLDVHHPVPLANL
ncbi:unnamed protein product [Nippostrongylus brasiliensis]|uniref:Aa_trans domain-containing protein n=1 Tax=Nippostrongylus brasiliensis TaxID=27835 RepID=A0A0N4YB62_NIPBR|nr:unnamed protein product [Nippostrongylus brasiliensis]